MMDGFKKFILKGNVVDLAVGVIIGSAFGAIVASFVKDIFNPLIGVFGGQPDFSRVVMVVGNNKFMVGNFLNTVIGFLINATVVYFLVVVPMNRLTERVSRDKKPLDPTTQKCPDCLSEIPIKARRCAFCTSVIHLKNTT
jgi:large conductance mechanosensitive channel